MKAEDIKKVASIGGGVIGGSWTVLFAMHGKEVTLFDINDDALAADEKTIVSNLDSLVEFKAITAADKDAILKRIHFTTDIAEAVKDAQFIQESGPERLNIKQDNLAKVEAAAPADAIFASSASGLPITEICANAVHPERCIGGHPYNPPHLIPLVEITKNDKTTDETLAVAKAFYESVGKEAVILNKPVPGYISNRLQLAVFRECIDLVMNGVCSVEDVDKALTFGPGIRWAIFGHNMIMQLGNKDGIKGMIDMLGGGYNLCADIAAWDTIPDSYGALAQAQVDEMMKNFPDSVGHNNADIAKYRDEMLINILKLHGKF